MKTMGNIRKLFLLLCLIMAGVQSVQAYYVAPREWINKHADVVSVPIGGVTYEVCHIYWKMGYVDESLGAQYEDDPGYKEREITSDDSSLLYIYTHQFHKPDDEYYASVVAITGSGEIVIQDSITNGNRKYPVKYIGRHTEQTLVEKDTTYYQQTWLSGSGYYKTTTCKYYGYTLTNVSITASNVSKLTVNGDVDFVGNFSLPSCSSVEFNKDVCFFANAFFNAMDIKFNGATTISQSATLSCYNVEELRFNRITHNGKINFGNSGSLTDIYYLSNLPAYSGSASNYFEGVNLNNVTAHVANKTQSECDAIHSGWATYCSFGDVVPYSTSGPEPAAFFSNQTFVRIGGNGTVSLTTKHEGETTSYNIPANGVVTAPLYEFDSGDIMRIVVTTNGEETVEIFRDGIDVTSIFTKNGTTYTYEANDWEANELWFGFMVNVLDEAVWTIKYIDQRQIIYFKDTAVKSICVNKWDTNSDGELSMAEAAAVTYFFGTPPFANNGNITSFDELQYFTSLKSLSLAFKGCTALKSVVIPASVTDVTNAFEDCVSLESVTFAPGSTLTTVGEKAFKGCASLEATFALPEGVTSIGTSAFEGCSTLGKTLGLPNSLTQISASAFKDCTSLSLIYIPKDVTFLRDPFFTGCTNLDYIAVDPENSVFDSRNCCNAIIERNVGAYLQSYLRYACKNSTIPEGVHVIGSSAFAGLPITQIELPSTITLVGNDAFTNCQYLESVVCKATTPPTYQGNPFNGISQDCVLTVPSGCTEAYKAAGWKTQDEDGVFKQIVEAEKSVTWNITQGGGMTGTQVIITRNGEEEESTLSSAFTAVKINNVGVEKVTLKVPVGHVEQVTKYRVRLLSYDENQDAALRNYLRQKFNMSSTRIALLLQTLGYIPTYFDTEEEALVIVGELATFNATSNIVSSLINQAVSDNVPIKVIYNGVDITSQMTFGDPLYAIYEVPIANLLNSAWEVSFDTSHRQTFVRSGGMLTTDIQYAIYNHELTVEIPNGIVTTVDLPPYSDTSENLQLNIRVADGESFKVLRNGIDVTYVFDYDEEEGYRNYFHNGGNISDEMSIQNWGFNTRDAAVWEIVYKSVEEQKKTLRVSNTDQMEIVYERHYTNGSTASEYFKNSETGEIAKYVERFFDDSDRENTRFIYLHVPIPESQPIRVLCNGEDVTYSQYDEWINEEWVSYMASAAQDQTWDISYDTSHKQTFIVKGGLYPEVNYEYKTGDITKDVQVGGITEVCLPDYNPDYDNGSADFTIGTLPNESFTALRNGVDVTDKFTKEVVSDNLWRYTFNFDNSDVAAALGVDLRDPAVWQITIGDTASYDLNNDNKVDISDVTKMVNEVLNR